MDTQLTWCWRPKSSLVYIQFAVVKICDAAVPYLIIGFKKCIAHKIMVKKEWNNRVGIL